jgi:hypothetical protein
MTTCMLCQHELNVTVRLPVYYLNVMEMNLKPELQPAGEYIVFNIACITG